MSLDRQTFEHRKALLQLGELLSDDDCKKIVFVENLPRSLEEKSPWEILAHLEVQGKTTVEELTRILKAINRHDVVKKAKKLIGKLHQRKNKDRGCKTLMLKDSLQLAVKHCKILVEQMDNLKYAANKDGNKRIEEIATEAKETLISLIQIKLRYARALFNSQTEISAVDSVDSSSSTSSLENSLTDRSPESSPQIMIRSRVTASELKKAAEELKKISPQKGSV